MRRIFLCLAIVVGLSACSSDSYYDFRPDRVDKDGQMTSDCGSMQYSHKNNGAFESLHDVGSPFVLCLSTTTTAVNK